MYINSKDKRFFDFAFGRLGYAKHCDRFMLIFHNGRVYRELMFGFYWRFK